MDTIGAVRTRILRLCEARLRHGAFGALPVQVYYLGIVHILTSCSVIRPLSPI